MTVSKSFPGRSGLEAAADDAIVLPMKEVSLGAESTSTTSAAKEDLLREVEGRSRAGSYILKCDTRINSELFIRNRL